MIPARAGAAAAPAGLRELVSDYYELTKPRIIYLLLITTPAAMVMAAHGIPPLALPSGRWSAARSPRARPGPSITFSTATSTR